MYALDKGFRTLAGIGISLLLVGCTAPEDEVQGPTPFNVVFISIDTLRADRLGSYGYERDTSPAIDALAKEGVLYERAYVPRGLTWPTLATVMTSLYPVEHGVRQNGVMLAPEHLQLPEVLKEAGYRTGAFITNAQQQAWKGFDKIVDGDDDTVTTAAMHWVQENHEEPFFAWVHLLAPHWNYIPPGEYATMFNPDYDGPIDGTNDTYVGYVMENGQLSPEAVHQLRALYDGEIRYNDELVSRLLGKIDSLGLRDNTLIVFFSDHGEELYDRHRYWDHFASVYSNVTHVPLIMRGPGLIPSGLRLPHVTELRDLAPTVLTLLDIDVPDEFGGQVLPLDAEVETASRTAMTEWEDRILNVITPEFSYMYNPSGFAPPMRRAGMLEFYAIEEEALYDLRDGSGDHENVITDHPDVARELREQAEAWAEKYGWTLNTEPYETPELPPEIVEELRALGYVD
jgi:arylsulfatase